jgi:hypothetical protein
VIIDGKKSGSSQTFRGVRQGSVLSSMLFSVVVDEVIRKVTEGKEDRLLKIMENAGDNSCMGTEP